MNFWLLNAVTATRLLVCAPVWFWCWWRRPKGMVLWMLLALVAFVATDHLDGVWAKTERRGTPPPSVEPFLEHVDAAAGTYTLESRVGFWLDHSADFVFYGVVVLSLIKGTREPAARRRSLTKRTTEPAAGATPPPAPDGRPAP
jgi:phosphatidylglycerophosphate synthase